MAIPAFVQAGAGITITGASGTAQITSGVTVGNVILLQILVDSGGTNPTLTTVTGIADIAGTPSAMTTGTASAVGNPIAGEQRPYFGRATATSVSVLITAGDTLDLYARLYEFSGVASGTALTDIIENGVAADGMALGAATSTTIADVAVTTNGADRLAVNMIAVNDDNALAAFSGQTGGTWVEPVAEYLDSTGTDGCIGIQTANMASAGTIDGGTITMASDGWGVIGFALKPAAAAGSTYTKTGFGRESA